MEHKQIIKGEYVFTPIKNAFNEKTAYWLSKAGHTISVYAFTAYNESELAEMLKDNVLDSYIAMFDATLKRLAAGSSDTNKSGVERTEDTWIEGIVFGHKDGNYTYWKGFAFSEEEKATVDTILANHETEGGSACGSLDYVATKVMSK